MGFSGTMKAAPLGRRLFQVRLSLDLLGLVYEMDGVFSNRDLPSTSRRQPKAAAVIYSILGVSWTPLTNSSKGASSAWFWGFREMVYGFWGENIVSQGGKILFRLCVCVYINVYIFIYTHTYIHRLRYVYNFNR